MSNLILVFVCLALGLILQRVKAFSHQSAAALNHYVIYVAFPAVILKEIPNLIFDLNALTPIIMAWLVMAFGAAITWLMARKLSWTRNVTGAMLLVITLGNTSFIGFPLIEAHLGSEAVPYAILYDQLGTFLALNTVGIAIASYYSDEHGEKSQPLWLKILKFPPFFTLLIAFALKPFEYPIWLQELLPRIASTLVPVVMVAVGLQWRLRLAPEHYVPVAVAVIFILFLEPAFAYAILQLMGVDNIIAHVIVLEAAMPAMISAGVLATAHQLAPRLASSIVGYTLMFSLLTVWGWKLVIV